MTSPLGRPLVEKFSLAKLALEIDYTTPQTSSSSVHIFIEVFTSDWYDLDERQY